MTSKIIYPDPMFKILSVTSVPMGAIVWVSTTSIFADPYEVRVYAFDLAYEVRGNITQVALKRVPGGFLMLRAGDEEMWQHVPNFLNPNLFGKTMKIVVAPWYRRTWFSWRGE